MAKRAEQLQAMAGLRSEKVPVCCPEKLAAFAARLIRYKELRMTKADGKPGKVYKAVGALEVMTHFAGMPNPITVEVDIEFGKNWGGLGELKQGIVPAIAEAGNRLGLEYGRFLDSKLPATDPNALPPLMGDRKPKPSQMERAKNQNAAQGEGSKRAAAERRAQREAEAAKTEAVTEQVEVPAGQFDEAVQPNPEKPAGGEA